MKMAVSFFSLFCGEVGTSRTLLRRYIARHKLLAEKRSNSIKIATLTTLVFRGGGGWGGGERKKATDEGNGQNEIKRGEVTNLVPPRVETLSLCQNTKKMGKLFHRV